MEDCADVYLAARLENRRGTLSRINEGLLLGTLAVAGVHLGTYDRCIIGWLAEREPETVQVVIGLIQHAYANGKAGA